MLLRSLGAAAGGGLPQWNCACARCVSVRAGGSPAGGTTHASVAVSGTGQRWFLLNATPDVHRQIEAFPALHPGPGVRETPLAGVLLTDAEFDHTIGLLLLREGAELAVWATEAVLGALDEHFPVRRLVGGYATFEWHELVPGRPVELDPRLRVSCFTVGCKRPRYAGGGIAEGAWVVAYRLDDPTTGRRAIYAPGVSHWTPELMTELRAADCVFVDGTFWTEDEMLTAGAGGLRAADMGHIPVGGEGGSARRLAELPGRRIYIHINNTNPMLDDSAEERRQLDELGIEIGLEGLEVEL